MSIQQREIEPGHLLTAGLSRNEGKAWVGVAGGTIVRGDLVTIGSNGTSKSHLEFVKAEADSASLSRALLFVAEHGASSGQQIRVAEVYILTDVNTAASGQGAPVFLSDTAGSWSLSAGKLPVVVGVVVVAHATDGIVLLAPQQSLHSLLAGGFTISSLILPVALTASAVETVLASAIVPASGLQRAARLRVHYKVRVTADAGATTLTVRLRLGTVTLTGTALVTIGATDTGVGNLAIGFFELTARAPAGAAVAIEGMGWHQALAGAGGAMISDSFDAANFATNGLLLLELTGQWSAADANSCQAEHFTVEIAN